MANNYEYYENLVKKITDTIDCITSSVSATSTNPPYTVATFFSKDRSSLSLVATNKTDGSYVRIMRKVNTYGIKFFTKENEKKWEFFKQITQNNTEKQRICMLFVGNDSNNRQDYLSDKVGIYEKSKYDSDKKCYTPLEITENYYNSDPNLVSLKLFEIAEDQKAAETLQKMFSHEAHADSIPVRAKIRSTDPEVLKMLNNQEPIEYFIRSTAIVMSYLKLYHFLNKTEIPDRINALFRSLQKELQDYIHSEAKIETDGTMSNPSTSQLDIDSEER